MLLVSSKIINNCLQMYYLEESYGKNTTEEFHFRPGFLISTLEHCSLLSILSYSRAVCDIAAEQPATRKWYRQRVVGKHCKTMTSSLDDFIIHPSVSRFRLCFNSYKIFSHSTITVTQMSKQPVLFLAESQTFHAFSFFLSFQRVGIKEVG